MKVHRSIILNNQREENHAIKQTIAENFLLTVVSVQAHNKQKPKPN